MKDHPKVNISEHHPSYNWLPDFVYGGIDGAVTTFAIVAGVVGASLSNTIILILGFANLLADGFSMAVGKYLSDKSHKEQYDRIKEIEFAHLKEKPEREKEEIHEILTNYGFKGKDLHRATKVITSNPEVWVDIMMRNEFKMTSENVLPLKGAITTFLSFAVIGFIPLIAYVVGPLIDLKAQTAFIITCIATLSALFLVGIIKSRFSSKHWLLSGLETAVIGGIAATIAFGVGYFLKSLF